MALYLVTGGAGFIGSHIAAALTARGDTVRVLDDFSTGRRENLSAVGDHELIEGDAADPTAIRRAMRGVAGVFHQAAMVSVPKSVDNPHENQRRGEGAFLAVLGAAREAGVRRVVTASSAAVYGDQPGLPKRETDLPSPISPYGASKAACELYARTFAATGGPDTACLRYFNVFGERQDPRSPYSGVISIFVDRLRAGRPLTVFGDGLQTRDFVYVGDVVRANLAAMDHAGPLGGAAFNVGCGNETTLLELIAALGRVLGVVPTVTHAPRREGDIVRSRADITRIGDTLGFAPSVTLDAGLARLIADDGGRAEGL